MHHSWDTILKYRWNCCKFGALTQAVDSVLDAAKLSLESARRLKYREVERWADALKLVGGVTDVSGCRLGRKAWLKVTRKLR